MVISMVSMSMVIFFIIFVARVFSGIFCSYLVSALNMHHHLIIFYDRGSSEIIPYLPCPELLTPFLPGKNGVICFYCFAK